MSRVINNIISSMSKNHIIMVLVLLIIFIFPFKVNATGTKDYSKFDWDSFYEKNKNYWTEMCENYDDGECRNTILYYQEAFYKKLYKLLAEYQKKGLYIADNVITTTVFFELFPNYGGNPEQEIQYTTVYAKKGLVGESRPAIKINDDYSADLGTGDEASLMKQGENLTTEEDTIKMLVSNAVAYYTYCYGIYGDPVTTDDNGTSTKKCPEGSSLTKIIQPQLGLNDEKCAVNLSASSQAPGNDVGYTTYMLSRLSHGMNVPIQFNIFGDYLDDDYYNECMTRKDLYSFGTAYTYVDQYDTATPHVSYTKYFDFLKTTKYFDNRLHLQSHFGDVLKAADVACLTSSVCSNSLEAKGEYDLYEDMLEADRLNIIKSIISLLNYQGMEISYEGYGMANYTKVDSTTPERGGYYWPIGSSEETTENGIRFAKGTPTKVVSDIQSYYGVRGNPITADTELHYGIDIDAEEGVTKIIAAYNGTVVSIVDNCIKGDYYCNEGYGNTVVIAHSNGDYTVYAHLSTIDPQIQLYTTVLTGEVLGLAGSTGATLRCNLLYELRVGGNSVANAVDPLTSTPAGKSSPPNVDDLRPKASSASGYGARSPKFDGTNLTKSEFVSLVSAYCKKRPSAIAEEMCNNPEIVYDASQTGNVNPELVIVRAIAEGNSPGIKKHNYWGVRCYNGQPEKCMSYSNLEEGVKGFGEVIQKYNNLAEMMSKYAYIGREWYNPGGWDVGGCKYFPLIKKFMSSTRQSEVETICSKTTGCSIKTGGDCTPTTQEDQDAYCSWQVTENMGPLFSNIFGT